MVEAEASKGGTIVPRQQVRQLAAAISVFVERRFGERGRGIAASTMSNMDVTVVEAGSQVGRQCVK
jgi:hypothetical protein